MSAHNNFFALRLIPAAINGLINGVITWAANRDATALGLWTEGAYGVDLMFTGFLLPSINWFIVRTATHIRAVKGTGMEDSDLPTPWLRHMMPTSFWGGGLFVGSIGTILGCGTVFAMEVLGSPRFSVDSYVAFKSAYSALLAAMLQPTMVFAALHPLILAAKRRVSD